MATETPEKSITLNEEIFKKCTFCAVNSKETRLEPLWKRSKQSINELLNDINVLFHSEISNSVNNVKATPLPRDVSDYKNDQDQAEEIVTTDRERIENFETYNIKISDIYHKLEKLSNPNSGSLLFDKFESNLTSSNIFSRIIIEMYEKCPELLNLLLYIIRDNTVDSKINTIATIYGMILNCLSKQASLVQRLLTAACTRYHADTKLLAIMNKMHLTLAPSSKVYFIDGLINFSEKTLLQKISEGATGKLNGDNLDLRVTTNDMRMDNRNKDYHFFASNWIADRIDVTELSDVAPIADANEACVKDILASNKEISDFRDTLKVHFGRKICEFMKGFDWMKKVIPTHIQHQYSTEMSTKSSIHILPIMLQNEQKYSDCVKIMDEYVAHINRWYSKTGRGNELADLKIPVGGDQLTRVRLQGAKSLRAGSSTIQDRFDQLEPIIVEFFHIMQDFLQKMCKKFLKLDKASDKGTLANLKVLIQRSNVNGNVKARFKAHEQFIDISGTAYLLLLVMKIMNMKSLDDDPSHPDIPKNIKLIHNPNKMKVFDKIMDAIIDSFFTLPFEEDKVEDYEIVDIQVDNRTSHVKVPIINGAVTISVLVNENQHNIQCKLEMLQDKTVKVNLPGEDKSVIFSKVSSEESDTLNNYVCNFMNWYSVLLSFTDAIKEGNMFQTNIIIKLMIPFFTPIPHYLNI